MIYGELGCLAARRRVAGAPQISESKQPARIYHHRSSAPSIASVVLILINEALRTFQLLLEAHNSNHNGAII